MSKAYMERGCVRLCVVNGTGGVRMVEVPAYISASGNLALHRPVAETGGVCGNRPYCVVSLVATGLRLAERGTRKAARELIVALDASPEWGELTGNAKHDNPLLARLWSRHGQDIAGVPA
mgnify:CR=1 FL=1